MMAMITHLLREIKKIKLIKKNHSQDYPQHIKTPQKQKKSPRPRNKRKHPPVNKAHFNQ
jgi:hypothetical protein